MAASTAPNTAKKTSGLRRAAQAPWLHFLLLGAALLWGRSFLPEPAPPPPQLQPAQLQAAFAAWARATGKRPNEAQRRDIARGALDRELLFREALRRGYHRDDPLVAQRLARDMRFLHPQRADEDDATLVREALEMGLHENETVVRRRLIQRMQRLAALRWPAPQPDAGDIAALREELAEQLTWPAQLTLQHVFFSSDRRRDALADARAALASGKTPRPGADGDAFLHGYRFKTLDARRAETLFGRDFSQALFALAKGKSGDPETAGRWSGPLRSSYGAHLVRVAEYRPPRPASDAEARPTLAAEWRRRGEARARRLQIEELRAQYGMPAPPRPAEAPAQ